jgi:hypothetical protein
VAFEPIFGRIKRKCDEFGVKFSRNFREEARGNLGKKLLIPGGTD